MRFEIRTKIIISDDSTGTFQSYVVGAEQKLSLYQWRQKLGQTQRSHGADRVSVSSGFVAVKVTETLVYEPSSWTLRVGGIELELPAHPDPHWLVGLVVAMKQRGH